MAKFLAVGLLLCLAQFALPVAFAQAPDPRTTSLTISARQDAELGKEVPLVAVLRDGAGQPIVDARVVFTSPATFAGASGEMAIGESWTDSKGIATLSYQLRIQGDNQFVARFYGDGTHQPAEAGALVRATSEVQLDKRTAGVWLPFFGAWTLAAVIATVWTVYFLGMTQVLTIPEARETGGWR